MNSISDRLPFVHPDPDEPEAVTEFRRLALAVQRDDFVTAKRSIRALRALGYQVNTMAPRQEGQR